MHSKSTRDARWPPPPVQRQRPNESGTEDSRVRGRYYSHPPPLGYAFCMQVKNGGGHGAKARRRLMGEMLREVPVIPSDLKSLAVLNEPLIAVWGVQGHTRPVLIWPSSALACRPLALLGPHRPLIALSPRLNHLVNTRLPPRAARVAIYIYRYPNAAEQNLLCLTTVRLSFPSVTSG